MSLVPTWIVGVSGHRQLDSERLEGAVKEALGRVRAALPEQSRIELLTSVAAGADLLALRVARAEGHATHVVLPMPWPEMAKDLGPAEATEAETALSLAGSVRVAPGSGVRPDCYADANTELVLACDAVIAIWDGEPGRGVGGTAELVAQARALGLALVWIHSQSGELVTERLEALGAHSNAPLLLQAERILHAPETDVGLAAGVRANLWRTLLVGLASSVVGAAAAAVGTASGLLPQFVWVGLLSAQSVLATWLFVERKVLSKRAPVSVWLERRFAVEVLAGLEASAGLVDPLRPALASVDPKWRRFAVSASTSLHARVAAGTWQERRDRYVAQRLLGERGQAPYFERVGGRTAQQAGRQARFARYAAGVALAATVFSLVWKGTLLVLRLAQVPSPLEGSLVMTAAVRFFPAALPAVAAGVLSVEFLFDRKRRATRYPLIAARLRNLAALLSAQSSEQGAKRLVEEAERLLMTELQEWLASEERASGKTTAQRAGA